MMKDFLNKFFLIIFVIIFFTKITMGISFSKNISIQNFEKPACLIVTKKDKKEDKVFDQIKCNNNYSIPIPEIGFDNYLCRYNFQKIKGLKQSLICKVFDYKDEIFIK